MNRYEGVLGRIKGGLIVSCQALETEPLYSPYIMSRMAYAAYQGGAVGIRANTPVDIRAIKEAVDLPLIGLYKQMFADSQVYITPTLEAVEEIAACGVDIIAIDATGRRRPGGISLEDFFREVRKRYPKQLFMADCSCYEDAVRAQELGFDLAGTTLRGYTQETKDAAIPDYSLLQRMTDRLDIPVIAEGGIWSPEQLKQALDCKVHAAVVGTAITRPMDITRRFTEAIK